MKATKKIVGAACALVAAVALSAGSTFAWFAANTSVSASGMTVSAKSDSVYLIIDTATNYNSSTSTNQVDTHSDASAQLLPVAHGATAGTATAITDAADMTDYSKWWYAYSNSLDNSDINSTTATTVGSAEGELAKYIASETFKVGLKSGSATSTNKKLTVKSVTLPSDKAIVLVLVCGNNIKEYKSNYTYNAEETSSIQQFTNTVNTDGVEITAYYYIDGESEFVYTSNIGELSGYVQFTIGLESAIS